MEKLDAHDMNYIAHVKAENIKAESLPSSLRGFRAVVGGSGDERKKGKIFQLLKFMEQLHCARARTRGSALIRQRFLFINRESPLSLMPSA